MKRFLVGFFCCSFIALTSGLFTFTAYVHSPLRPQINEPLEGGVVFTGDRNRINAGFRLLHFQKIKKLLISGVSSYSRIEQIVSYSDPAYPPRTNVLDCCVSLDKKATNTIGNIEQTILWAKRTNIQSIALITSDYHMPRSRLLFFLQNSDLDIHPYPVRSDPPPHSYTSFLRHISKMMHEYIKVIFTLVALLPYWLFPS